ncbi:glycerophosphodiester phosphodiesterase [Niabella terrae]
MNRKLLIAVAIVTLMAGCAAQKAGTHSKRPIHFPNKVIAHRGAWKNTGAPENSIASLKDAIALGCGGSEFDIHMTSDEVLVVNHNNDFLGLPIEKHTYQELLQKKLPNGESIPTLESYLKTGYAQDQTIMVAEIKTSVVSKERSLQLAEKVVALVKELKGQSKTVYIAFDYDVCKKVKALDPLASVQYLNGDIRPDQLKPEGLDLDYNQKVFEKNPTWIKEAKAIGVVTNAWTVNDPKAMDALLADGVDFLTTNEPELLLKKLKK